MVACGAGGGGGGSGGVAVVQSTRRAMLPPSLSSSGLFDMDSSSEIHAPTPLYKLPYNVDPAQAATPSSTAGSEIEAILAEKGKTGENVIRMFPRIASCDEFSGTGGMLRVESLHELANLSRSTASPVRQKAHPDEIPSDFPVAVPGARSCIDLSALDDGSSAGGWGSSNMLVDLDGDEIEPPSRSANPMKTHLSASARRESAAGAGAGTQAQARRVVAARRPYGAELRLNTLSPPLH